MISEETLKVWAKPPSQSEQEKCDNAETAIQKAIQNSDVLNEHKVSAFAQGSYKNRTNVRLDSDVDICVICRESIFFDLPEGKKPGDFDISTPASYRYPEFKSDVERALIDQFGDNAVTRGNKAFDIHENTYRVDADAVVCFEYRRYHTDGTYLVGTAFYTDDGSRIINWPQQNYNNGVSKNTITNKGFKAGVRMVKNCRNAMLDDGVIAAKGISSFLLESLAWNAPDTAFTHETYTADLRSILAFLFNNTIKVEDSKEWGEINELKYLFRSAQPWTLEQVHDFLGSAWDFVGFE